MKLDKQLPVERFEATASQSTVPSPPVSYSARPGILRDVRVRRSLLRAEGLGPEGTGIALKLWLAFAEYQMATYGGLSLIHHI